MQLGSMFICNSNIAVTNKHTAKLHHVGSFIYIYIFTYDARKPKHKIVRLVLFMDIIAVHCMNHLEHVNTPSGQNAILNCS